MNTYIEVEPGIELFVQDIGSGEPIVFIPGFTFLKSFPSRSSIFQKLTVRL
ncbi:hypothetical protein [Rossellomorea aquimaris]|uniref:hypothetical protein n=1 Tax=Rossellomorea aquimaris TaxID=189382 RepID=UPI0032B4B1F0